MDKAIVLGTFEFIGFHYSSYLLERGYEVTGVRYPESNEVYSEMMQLEVGRNANFNEVEHHIWNLSNLENPSVIFIDYYDLYIKQKEQEVFQSLISPILQEKRESIKKSGSKIVITLPIQLLAKTKEREGKHSINSFLDMLKGEEIPIQIFYLPTIYGPWQPNEFLFQKSLLGILDNENLNEKRISPREWKEDAIFVKDVVKEIVHLTNDNHSSFTYLLKSNLKNHWEQCANYLSLNIKSEPILFEIEENQPPIKTVIQKVNFQEGLNEQRKVLKFF
ncbi:hypothetical protein [Bacillus massilinigeriensis]|uniref:hypothetical protein n=1 Tax=Bacillus massilionigeriensis TaxID=1805475 RepID=UPI00096B34D6|nr:hypothetical protein [Bacillus massilionigeriensis]